MKIRETALRLKRFEAEEKSRRVKDIEFMIREFSSMANDLDRQIKIEEDRTGIKDFRNISYSMLAKSLAERRNNLVTSVEELQLKRELAIKERDDAIDQLARSEAHLNKDLIKLTSRDKEQLDSAVLG
ncbi:MAG: flagellar export protein FliJ [Hyphomicrobium sp.]